MNFCDLSIYTHIFKVPDTKVSNTTTYFKKGTASQTPPAQGVANSVSLQAALQ
jgi:hypothetical protein